LVPARKKAFREEEEILILQKPNGKGNMRKKKGPSHCSRSGVAGGTPKASLDGTRRGRGTRTGPKKGGARDRRGKPGSGDQGGLLDRSSQGKEHLPQKSKKQKDCDERESLARTRLLGRRFQEQPGERTRDSESQQTEERARFLDKPGWFKSSPLQTPASKSRFPASSHSNLSPIGPPPERKKGRDPGLRGGAHRGFGKASRVSADPAAVNQDPARRNPRPSEPTRRAAGKKEKKRGWAFRPWTRSRQAGRAEDRAHTTEKKNRSARKKTPEALALVARKTGEGEVDFVVGARRINARLGEKAHQPPVARVRRRKGGRPHGASDSPTGYSGAETASLQGMGVPWGTVLGRPNLRTARTARKELNAPSQGATRYETFAGAAPTPIRRAERRKKKRKGNGPASKKNSPRGVGL